VIIIANTPGWFSFIWRMIKPLVNETTQVRTRVASAASQLHNHQTQRHPNPISPTHHQSPTPPKQHHKHPQKKIRIVPAGKETTEAIAEFVDPADIPVEYGGQLRYGDGADSCRWNSPEEVALREHVHAINKRCAEARAAAGVPTPVKFEPPNLGGHRH
jgi:hypothetical protein